MLRLLRYTIIATIFLVAHHRVDAQEIKVGADFTTLFDNKEYAGMESDISGTIFSARLTPRLGVEWHNNNELVLAADLVQDFGHDSKFLSDVNVQLYYGYNSDKLKLYAGIFPRDKMVGLNTPLFFAGDYRYYHNRLGGVLARHEWAPEGSYVEFAMDYTGMRDFDTREAFMIMSSLRQNMSGVYVGYDFMMGHYAKDYNPDTIDGVVDNILLTPTLGYGYDFFVGGGNHTLSLSAEARYVLSLQRDRINENVWESPMGGELFVALNWRGLEFSNRLFIGKGSLLTYYNRYGAELYHGAAMYRTSKGIYDAIAMSYKQHFFDDTVHLKLGITAEYDGTKWGTRQWLQLDVDLDYGIPLKRNE